MGSEPDPRVARALEVFELEFRIEFDDEQRADALSAMEVALAAADAVVHPPDPPSENEVRAELRRVLEERFWPIEPRYWSEEPVETVIIDTMRGLGASRSLSPVGEPNPGEETT